MRQGNSGGQRRESGAVDERLVMGCGPPSSWRIFQGTLEARESQPRRRHVLSLRTPGHHASSLLNFTPQRLRLRIKECGCGMRPTSLPCSSAVRAADIGSLALYSTYCRCRWRCSAESMHATARLRLSRPASTGKQRNNSCQTHRQHVPLTAPVCFFLHVEAWAQPSGLTRRLHLLKDAIANAKQHVQHMCIYVSPNMEILQWTFYMRRSAAHRALSMYSKQLILVS